MGRALTYTPEVQERLLKALRAGSALRDAAAFARVPWSTFCGWMRAGRQWHADPSSEGADERFAGLVDDVDQATREADVALVGLARRASEKDWRAALALLEFRAEAPTRRAQLAKARADAKLAQRRAGAELPLPELRAMLPPRRLALLLAHYTQAELDEATAVLASLAPPTEPSPGG